MQVRKLLNFLEFERSEVVYDRERNDYFYVCSLIEFVARRTKNKRSVIVNCIGEKGREVEELMKIFNSFISDEISNFSTDLYYQNPDYLECSYRTGYLLD